MTRLLEQEEFESLIPDSVDVRPLVAKQVRRYFNSKHYHGPDTDIGRTEAFLRRVERKGYAKKIIQEKKSGQSASSEDSAPYHAMLKNWARKSPGGQEDFARGTLYHLFREIGPPFYFLDAAKRIWDPHDIAFQKLFCAKFYDGPENAKFKDLCERYYAKNDVIRRQFKEIWTGPYVGPPPVVKLGPISISMGYKDGLERLLVDDMPEEPFFQEGMPNIFKALSWRTRLTRLHGRQREFDRLLKWALQPDDVKVARPRVMLINGSGGAGKSRLVADVVEELIDDYGWAGGQLPSGKDYTIEIDGDGVAIIIDYPEERIEFVKQILAAATKPHDGGRPVRVILVSREDLGAWQDILNVTYLSGIEEVRLGDTPYLDKEDAIQISEDVAADYPEEIGKLKVLFSDVEEWLDQDRSHRLPLMILAASVHAVLEPELGFTLSAKKVLLAFEVPLVS